MADVKWIKITTDIFDDEKILLIESLPEADSIIVIWFKLLCLAGKMNNSGVFMMNSTMPYTDKMLATIFRRKEATVQMALKTFEQFGMVEIVCGVITIPNWGKHQSLERIEERKKYQREYQREYRKKQKQLTDSKYLRKHLRENDVNTLEEEREGEEELDKEGEKKIDYGYIVQLYNVHCPSLQTVKSISESRKKAIKARLNKYSVDDFKELFQKAEASDFLKGANDRNWSANFDWLIKDANMAKVLDGNYDNKKPYRTEVVPNWMKKKDLNNFERRRYDMDALESGLLNSQEQKASEDP